MAPADQKSSPGWKSCLSLEVSKSCWDDVSRELDSKEGRAGDKRWHVTLGAGRALWWWPWRGAGVAGPLFLGREGTFLPLREAGADHAMSLSPPKVGQKKQSGFEPANWDGELEKWGSRGPACPVEHRHLMLLAGRQ